MMKLSEANEGFEVVVAMNKNHGHFVELKQQFVVELVVVLEFVDQVVVKMPLLKKKRVLGFVESFLRSKRESVGYDTSESV